LTYKSEGFNKAIGNVCDGKVRDNYREDYGGDIEPEWNYYSSPQDEFSLLMTSPKLHADHPLKLMTILYTIH